MKRLSLSIVAFSIFLLIQGCGSQQSQETNFDQLESRNNLYYLKGEAKPYTGKAARYFENGKKSYEEDLNNGIKNGKVREWYESGQLKAEWSFKNAKPHGKCLGWYANGKEEYKRNYEEGKPAGEWITFFETTGRKKSEETYKDGKSEGKFFEYNDKGEIINEIKFRR